ncbi:MAG: class I SAM-dependent methyltransferase [Saprospiraceae bacterium]|nr:hypothetical protein [Lewinella sp.]
MLFKFIKANKAIEDEEFDHIYPEAIREVADTHFTPIQVSKFAARALADRPNIKILDIGSGVGKFCTIGSVCSEGYFVGVEQRTGLCNIAKGICSRYNLTNVEIINANILDISFTDFEAFYFFNPFQENLSVAEKIDDEVELRRELFYEYSLFVKEQLAAMPTGTKIVTYYSFLREIPESYTLKSSAFNEKLKVWEKTDERQ